MSERVTPAMYAEYEAFNQTSPYGHFCQSLLWAKQKPMWKWEAVVSRTQQALFAVPWRY